MLNLNKFYVLMVLAAIFSLASCGDDDDDDNNDSICDLDNHICVTANISSNTTWTNDNTYILQSRISVTNGATLTIEPGTVIKGAVGTGANATALLVARGAQIDAQGTASAPIIFTSVADNLTSEMVAAGTIMSPNLDPSISGLWGGVLVLGNAPISASSSPVQIEGIPLTDTNGLYGGSDAADNSGTIRYVSIRHGGSNIGEGNEINGLTLGGVGSATTIEYVEVVANKDDGIEWFGGTVNVTNAVVWNAGDDGIDTDQAWSGTLDNFIVITPGDHNFELDGPEGTATGMHTIKNGTVVASSGGDLINMDNNSMVALENIFITNIGEGFQINRVEATEGNITFTNIILDVAPEDLASHVNGEVPAGVVAGDTPQADKSVFNGWSWAAVSGNLSTL